MARTKLHDVELWDGRRVVCAGFRDGLPVWGYNAAPAGLVTKKQLWSQKLRRHRGQDPVGLLVFRKRGCGEQVAELFRIDVALSSRPMSARWRRSIQAMNRSHRTCRECGRVAKKYRPTSTWKCWPCTKKTGDYGAPPGVEIDPATEPAA
jgi:ribosomal protein L37AE/L43A